MIGNQFSQTAQNFPINSKRDNLGPIASKIQSEARRPSEPQIISRESIEKEIFGQKPKSIQPTEPIKKPVDLNRSLNIDRVQRPYFPARQENSSNFSPNMSPIQANKSMIAQNISTNSPIIKPYAVDRDVVDDPTANETLTSKTNQLNNPNSKGLPQDSSPQKLINIKPIILESQNRNNSPHNEYLKPFSQTADLQPLNRPVPMIQGELPQNQNSNAHNQPFQNMTVNFNHQDSNSSQNTNHSNQSAQGQRPQANLQQQQMPMNYQYQQQPQQPQRLQQKQQPHSQQQSQPQQMQQSQKGPTNYRPQQQPQQQPRPQLMQQSQQAPTNSQPNQYQQQVNQSQRPQVQQGLNNHQNQQLQQQQQRPQQWQQPQQPQRLQQQPLQQQSQPQQMHQPQQAPVNHHSGQPQASNYPHNDNQKQYAPQNNDPQQIRSNAPEQYNDQNPKKGRPTPIDTNDLPSNVNQTGNNQKQEKPVSRGSTLGGGDDNQEYFELDSEVEEANSQRVLHNVNSSNSALSFSKTKR